MFFAARTHARIHTQIQRKIRGHTVHTDVKDLQTLWQGEEIDEHTNKQTETNKHTEKQKHRDRQMHTSVGKLDHIP